MAPCVTEAGVAPIDVCDGALLTTSGVIPVEPTNTESPVYVAEIVSVPTGASEEVQEPEAPVPALDNCAVQSVDPVENVTDPVGLDNPVTLVVTVAE